MTGEVVASTVIGGFDVNLRFVDNDVPPWTDDTFAHAKYSIRFGHGGSGVSFPFWQSEHGTREGEHPPIERVVETVARDALDAIDRGGPLSSTRDRQEWLEGLDEIARDFGYKNPSEATRVWFNLNSTARKLLDLYTEDEIRAIENATREDQLDDVEIFD